MVLPRHSSLTGPAIPPTESFSIVSSITACYLDYWMALTNGITRFENKPVINYKSPLATKFKIQAHTSIDSIWTALWSSELTHKINYFLTCPLFTSLSICSDVSTQDQYLITWSEAPKILACRKDQNLVSLIFEPNIFQNKSLKICLLPAPPAKNPLYSGLQFCCKAVNQNHDRVFWDSCATIFKARKKLIYSWALLWYWLEALCNGNSYLQRKTMEPQKSSQFSIQQQIY